MGRRAVRQAVAAWFQPPAAAGLNTVYTAEPRQVPGDDFFRNTPSGTASGAVAYPYLEGESERRIAFGGPASGWKARVYDVAMVVRFMSNQQRGEDAQDDHDATVDALKARLRADRRLGDDGAVIFQAGEGDTVGSPDIQVMSDLPKRNGEQILIWSVVRFQVVEMVQA